MDTVTIEAQEYEDLLAIANTYKEDLSKLNKMKSKIRDLAFEISTLETVLMGITLEPRISSIERAIRSRMQ